MVQVKEKNASVMKNKPKAYIVSEWKTGLGDGYVNILNSYYTMKDLESMGYDVFFVKNIVKNVYFNSLDPKLFCEIYDLSLFGDKVIFNSFGNSCKNDVFETGSELEDTHIQINLACKSYRIFVEEKLNEIDNYQLKLATINDSENIKNKKYDFIAQSPQFLNKNIISEMEKFISFTNGDLSGISMRISDQDLYRTDIFDSIEYKSRIDLLKSFLKNCPSKHIFLSSSNINGDLMQQLKKLDDRLFVFNFTHNLPMHCTWTANDYKDNINDFLHHTKELAINMACFSRCKHIGQICGNPSCFMAYGFYHNTHHPLPSERSMYPWF
jgi:hypothetical protein